MLQELTKALMRDSEFNALLTPLNKYFQLYHYTTIEGLLGIISEKAFFAFDVRFMNDPSDAGEYSIKLTEDILKRSDLDAERRDFLTILKDLLKAKTDEDIRCAISFSQSVDKLSQWRGYSGTELGYCIVFDVSKLEKEFQKQFYIWHIEYNRENQIKIFDSIFRIASQFKKDNHVDLDDYNIAVITVLLVVMQNFKHPSYYEEEEVRITYSKFFDSENRSEIEFKTKDGYVIPFVRFSFPIESIKEIYIENKPGAGVAKSTLQAYLKDMNFNIPCKISEIPRK